MLKHIKRMDNHCHIPVLVHAFSYVTNVGLNLVLCHTCRQLSIFRHFRASGVLNYNPGTFDNFFFDMMIDLIKVNQINCSIQLKEMYGKHLSLKP